MSAVGSRSRLFSTDILQDVGYRVHGREGEAARPVTMDDDDLDELDEDLEDMDEDGGDIGPCFKRRNSSVRPLWLVHDLYN